MRPHSVTEVDVADDLARWQIYDEHFVSVDTRLAHAGASVNGHKGAATVGRGGDFVAMNSGVFSATVAISFAEAGSTRLRLLSP